MIYYTPLNPFTLNNSSTSVLMALLVLIHPPLLHCSFHQFPVSKHPIVLSPTLPLFSGTAYLSQCEPLLKANLPPPATQATLCHCHSLDHSSDHSLKPTSSTFPTRHNTPHAVDCLHGYRPTSDDPVKRI